MLFLIKNFNKYIVNIRRFYATYKNKVSIIIWKPTVQLNMLTQSLYIFHTMQIMYYFLFAYIISTHTSRSSTINS